MEIEEKAIELIKKFNEAKPSPIFDRMHLKDKGIGFILFYLDKHKTDEVIAGDLAFNLGVSTARIAVLLTKMENKELIKKTQASYDARKTIVSLTEEGIRQIEKIKMEGIRRMKLLLEEVGEEDLNEFLRIMIRIKGCIEKEYQND